MRLPVAVPPVPVVEKGIDRCYFLMCVPFDSSCMKSDNEVSRLPLTQVCEAIKRYFVIPRIEKNKGQSSSWNQLSNLLSCSIAVEVEILYIGLWEQSLLAFGKRVDEFFVYVVEIQVGE